MCCNIVDPTVSILIAMQGHPNAYTVYHHTINDVLENVAGVSRSSKCRRCGRFAKVNSVDLAKAAKGVIPVNTEASTQWARKNFKAWAQNCSCSTSEEVPDNLLCNQSVFRGFGMSAPPEKNLQPPGKKLRMPRILFLRTLLHRKLLPLTFLEVSKTAHLMFDCV